MIAKEKVINNASELAQEFNNLLKLIHEDLDALHKKVDIIEKQIKLLNLRKSVMRFE